MSNNVKIVIGLVIVLVLLACGYYWYTTQSSSNTTGENTAGETTALPSGTNTSDAALSQDLNSIDTQMQGVSSDNANMQASVAAALQ